MAGGPLQGLGDAPLPPAGLGAAAAAHSPAPARPGRAPSDLCPRAGGRLSSFPLASPPPAPVSASSAPRTGWKEQGRVFRFTACLPSGAGGGAAGGGGSLCLFSSLIDSPGGPPAPATQAGMRLHCSVSRSDLGV